MKKVYGYIRVSTAKQGQGVSLIEQKDAISRYAEKYNLQIVEWFEEKETAAKHGRPLFTNMMNLLKRKKADGVIIHKIDRSARNYRDWVDISDLIDKGCEVHFAHETLDMNTRGGRLAADIQVAVAVDYIRNLRQEAVKGLYGRLKQGIYPFHAPLGYVNTGKGKLKTIDPEQGSLVKKAFELYATRQYSLRDLAEKMYAMGLRNRRGRKVIFTKLSIILSNSFYMGLMNVKGAVFNGNHEPLVSPDLFRRVQLILSGKTNQATIKHDFLFRKKITCELCGYSLVGERQKGHVYYRCHTKTCRTKAVRETAVERCILNAFTAVQLSPKELDTVNDELKAMENNWDMERQTFLKGLTLQIGQLQEKIERLIDCYIEQELEKEIFEARKTKLLIELKEKREVEKDFQSQESSILKTLRQFLELSKSLVKSYEIGISEERRELVEMVTSNLTVSEKKLSITMHSPFQELANRFDFSECGHNSNTPRIKKREIDLGSLSVVSHATPVSSPGTKPLGREQLKTLLEVMLDKAECFPKTRETTRDKLSE